MASQETAPVPAIIDAPQQTNGQGEAGRERGARANRGRERTHRGRDHGSRGGGEGRNRGPRNRPNGTNNPQSNGTEPGLPTASRPFGGGLSTATTQKVEHPVAESGEEDVEAEVCFICASPVVHNAVAPCNHRTCHICALRLRALYKTKACAHCRTTAEMVIFTDDANKRYEDYTIADFSSQDPNLGIYYEKPEIFEDTVLLLRYNCPDGHCEVACLGWPDLHRHVRSVHHKVMCDLCTRNKKVFTHEHELFTQQELKKHERFGDDTPGAIDQSGFKGHPECGFCRQRFYGDDELFAHCRDKHERCHVCDRRDGGRNPQYYLDYNALEGHFRKDHFLCPDQECLEKKFVVFESEMDLKAHQLEAHPNGLTKDARRDARRVDMSGFDYRQPHQEERPRREGRGGRGRGRDPNAEPLPMSSAQPMRRDELAYQRAMAIQSAQSVTTRNFGGQLTQPEVAAPLPGAREPRSITAPRPSSQLAPPPLDSLHLTEEATPTPLTPQEQARRLRHAAVTERAATLLRNDTQKLSDFRARVSSYRSNAISAAQLIDAFFSLFDTSSAELGKLIKELAEIFEVPGKRDGLLKAWGDWKAINEDYPTLPGPSGGSANGGTTTAASVLGRGLGSGGSNRILKLKSSTAQSSRSAVSRSGSWGNSSSQGPSNASSVPFPALGSGTKKNASSAPAWAPSSALSSATPSARTSPAPSQMNRQPAAAPRGAGGDLFPALPAAKKPTSTIFTPGTNSRGIIRPASAAPTNYWASSGGSNGSSKAGSGVNTPVSPGEGESEGVGGAGGKKKGKKGREVLFQWG